MDADLDDDQVDEQLDHRYPVLLFFTYGHLRSDLQEVSRPFHHLAYRLARELPHNAETAMMLRKLIEAKDCAVRSALSRRLS